MEYGAARCSAKWTTASGCSSLRSWTRRSYSLATSRLTNLISFPDTSFHAWTRTCLSVNYVNPDVNIVFMNMPMFNFSH